MAESSVGRSGLKGELWRLGVEWVNLERGAFDINCGVLFRRDSKLLVFRPQVSVVEFGPYAQQPTGCEANGNLSSFEDAVPPQKAGIATAVQMKDIVEAQFYVAVDKAPVKEYEIELKIVLETPDLSDTFSYELSTIKVNHRMPVVGLHYITREIKRDGLSMTINYDPAKTERFASRRELTRSMSTWHDFDWEERRLQLRSA